MLLPFEIRLMRQLLWEKIRFCPDIPVHKGKAIVLSLLSSLWLAVAYCLVYNIGSCVPIHEDRTENHTLYCLIFLYLLSISPFVHFNFGSL